MAQLSWFLTPITLAHSWEFMGYYIYILYIYIYIYYLYIYIVVVNFIITNPRGSMYGIFTYIDP